MLNPPQGSSQSRFSSFPYEFQRWNYRAFDDTDNKIGEYYYGLSDALRSLGVPRRDHDWKYWRVTHGDLSFERTVPLPLQTYVVNGHQYRVWFLWLQTGGSC